MSSLILREQEHKQLGHVCPPHLVVLAAGAKAEDEQVSVGVGGCKVLAVRAAFTVKQRSVTLALDLSTRQTGRQTHVDQTNAE